MTDEKDFPLEGGCACGAVRYRMISRPMFVNCCHCRWCQRETGASFALNAIIEADRVVLLSGSPELVDTPSQSGKGQKFARCPSCRVALWSNYGGAGDSMRFVRVGTLDEPDCLPPDMHIFTTSKRSADRVVLLSGSPELVDTPSQSGKGQKFARCPSCRVALWSNYGGAGDSMRFVRVGTLDEPDCLPPDMHIFTTSKQPWVVLPPDTPAAEEFYNRDEVWPEESLTRRRALVG